MTNNTERRLALTRELLTSLAGASNQEKQAFAVFMNRYRLDGKAEILPLPGASSYERILLESGQQIALKREGSLHLLLNIGSKAAIEAWAQSHRCEVNPRTGTVQIYEVPATAVSPEKEAACPDEGADSARSS